LSRAIVPLMSTAGGSTADPLYRSPACSPRGIAANYAGRTPPLHASGFSYAAGIERHHMAFFKSVLVTDIQEGP
jgi:hypothetical protein